MSEAANDAFREISEQVTARVAEATGRAGGGSTAQAEGVALRTGGAGGTFNGMDVVDAKIAAAEARGEAQLEKALGALRLDISKLASTSTVYVTAITLFFGLAGLLVAFLAFGGDQFGRGADIATIARAAAREAIQEQVRTQPPPAPPK